MAHRASPVPCIPNVSRGDGNQVGSIGGARLVILEVVASVVPCIHNVSRGDGNQGGSIEVPLADLSSLKSTTDNLEFTIAVDTDVGKWEGDSGSAARRKGYCRRSEEICRLITTAGQRPRAACRQHGHGSLGTANLYSAPIQHGTATFCGNEKEFIILIPLLKNFKINRK